MRVHEGYQIEVGYPERRTWTRACNCEGATASGPRIVYGNSTMKAGKVFIHVSHVPLACDECDTPWEKEPRGR